jgi:hypothetical protein
MREQLPGFIAEIEREAARRDVELHGWRDYPRSISFGYRADEHGNVDHVSPPQKRRRKRTRTPPATPPGELMGLLEKSLAAEVAKSNRHQN